MSKIFVLTRTVISPSSEIDNKAFAAPGKITKVFILKKENKILCLLLDLLTLDEHDPDNSFCIAIIALRTSSISVVFIVSLFAAMKACISAISKSSAETKF